LPRQIAADALGPDRVWCVNDAKVNIRPQIVWKDAKLCAERIGVRYECHRHYVRPANAVLRRCCEPLVLMVLEPEHEREENIQSPGIRGLTLMAPVQ